MFLTKKRVIADMIIFAGTVARNAASTEIAGAINIVTDTAQAMAGTDITSVISIYTATEKALLFAVPKRRCIIRLAPIKTNPKPVLATISEAVRLISGSRMKCTGMKHTTLSTAILGICSHSILISFLKGFSGIRYT